MRSFSPSRTRRTSQPDRNAAVAAEVLEERILLTFANDFGVDYAADPEYDSQVIGRASDGTWWTSEFDLATQDYGPDVTTTFTTWSTAVDWRFVGDGDFDGDGLSDLAGWDPAGGGWWVSLSDGIGSTTMLGVEWSTATTWSDVTIADANADGLDDLIGRAGDGGWWAAIANGDGTFRNVASVAWDANAGWRDVFVADLDGNGLNDIVGRSSAGVWQASYGFGFTDLTITLGQWDESQGWQDARLARLPYEEGGDTVLKPAIVARSQTGQWQAIAFDADRTATTTVLGRWNEAANWRDVVTADIDGDGVSEIIGRTDYGEWWASNWNGTTFTSRAIGSWVEAAGWNDVYVATVGGGATNVLVGRTDDGAWWASRFDTAASRLEHKSVGFWSPAANWQDVDDGRFTRSPVTTRSFTRRIDYRGTVYEYPYQAVNIYAHRSGVIAHVSTVRANDNFAGVNVTYRVPSAGYEFTRHIPVTPFTATIQSIRFFGRDGDDAFVNHSAISSVAHGLGGDDTLSGVNSGVYDELFGGPGVDTLFGDPNDKLVQD